MDTLFFYPNDLETRTRSVKKVDFQRTLYLRRGDRERGLNYFLGSSFSTFGTVRRSLAFLKRKK